MKIRRLAYALGAEVSGIDLARDLDDSTIDAIRKAWLEHLVLVFPEQDLSPEQHIAFSRRFGQLERHPLKNLRGSQHPEILELTNRTADGKRSETADVGRLWHSDGAYTLAPPAGSLLYCRAIPDVGGNTWFANMYAAYEGLSARLRSVLDDLEVVNDIAYFYGKGGVGARDARKVAAEMPSNPPVAQPMVRVHPQTGQKALYLNESVTRQIDGMTFEESRGLLEYLFRHSVRPELTYRHYWRKNDLLMWDNRCVLHLAPKDYDDGQLRLMSRTTLSGSPCGRIVDH